MFYSAKKDDWRQKIMAIVKNKQIYAENEYDLIRCMNGNTYKLLNIIRIMMKKGNTDSEGYVVLSHAKISLKMNIGNNVTRIIRDLEKYANVIEIKRGDTTTPNKFRIKDEFKML